MNAVIFDHVTLTFGERRVLSGVSFSIPQGAFVGLLGSNGAGKTTLLRAILGLIRPQSGEIAVLGQPPKHGNADIGYIPQLRRTTPQAHISGLDLVMNAIGGHRWGRPLPSRSDREAAMNALDQAEAADIAQRPLAELSGGERQRILIAQALIGSPKLLLLDEPLISLDAAHQRQTVELAHGLCRRLGIAVIFCSHEINPILGAVDKVLYLGNGNAAIGSVEEVISAPVLSGLYGTPISVLEIGGRIFVMADGIHLEGGAHVHDV